MTADALLTTLLIVGALNLVGLLMLSLRVGDRRREEMSLEQRIVRLEVRVDALPTHRDLAELHRAIGNTGEAIATLAGQTQTMTTMLRTLQRHLLGDET